MHVSVCEVGPPGSLLRAVSPVVLFEGNCDRLQVPGPLLHAACACPGQEFSGKSGRASGLGSLSRRQLPPGPPNRLWLPFVSDSVVFPKQRYTGRYLG
jgi:hypothetical protein